jgi:hypothetical protein
VKQNFLQLCGAVYLEGGISGEITSTQNQNGEAKRVVNWVRNAYLEILNDQGLVWKPIHKTVVVQLTRGQGTYTFADLNLPQGVQWDTHNMRVAINADLSDETFVIHMDFRQFRDYWLFSTRRAVISRPLNVSVDNDTNLRIAPLPDGDYWLNMQYQTMPQTFQDDTDISVLPERYDNAIMWRALRHYGLFEAAPEVVARADMAYKETMQQLWLDQAPEVLVGDPLC